MKLFLFIITFGLLVQSAAAAGLAVEPSRLQFDLRLKEAAVKTITLENISPRVVLYQLYFDELEDILAVDQESLRLGPYERAVVRISAKPDRSGILITNLSIVGQELDRRQFNMAFGAKVPITLEVSQTAAGYLSFPLKLATIIILSLTAVILLIRIIKRRQRHLWWDSTLNLLHHRPWWKRILD